MQIYLARNNQQAGPYSLEQLNQMLANQQVLLTDLVWHQGMHEWKGLGELTQGKLAYEPAGYHAPVAEPISPIQPTQPSSATPKIQAELASIGTRVLAKVIDLLLWLPAAAIPSFFLQADQFGQLSEIQQKMQAATTATQASELQTQLFQLIPTEAWFTMAIYLLIMLGIQAFFLAKNGQSIGKKITKIQIVDIESSEKVSLLRVFTLRSVVFIVLNMLFMPFVTIVDHVFGLTGKRQTLHDKLAKTKVIKQSFFDR